MFHKKVEKYYKIAISNTNIKTRKQFFPIFNFRIFKQTTKAISELIFSKINPMDWMIIAIETRKSDFFALYLTVSTTFDSSYSEDYALLMFWIIYHYKEGHVKYL